MRPPPPTPAPSPPLGQRHTRQPVRTSVHTSSSPSPSSPSPIPSPIPPPTPSPSSSPSTLPSLNTSSGSSLRSVDLHSDPSLPSPVDLRSAAGGGGSGEPGRDEERAPPGQVYRGNAGVGYVGDSERSVRREHRVRSEHRYSNEASTRTDNCRA